MMRGSAREGLLLLLTVLALVTIGVKAQGEDGEVSVGYHVCCDINTTDALCYNTCMEALGASALITPLQIQAVSSACSPLYTGFWSCVNTEVNVTNEIPTKPPMSPYYHCCFEGGVTQTCREACKMHLATAESYESAISLLTAACGSPVSIPISPVWTCIVTPIPTEPPTITDPNGIPSQPPFADWARVQCCNKAHDQVCRDSCLDLYTGLVSSDSWSIFQLDCIHRPSESRLSTCLADVSSPCKLGCTGPNPQDQLTFCTNFNNRPAESFRQCNNAADRMAKNSFYSWIRTGVVQHPQYTLFVNDIESCLPEMWKAVACITHIQPCHPTTHITQICRKDCIDLLSKCSESDVTPQAVCDMIAPANTEEYCISISDYLNPSPVTYKDALIIENPCDPNPCAEGYFCAINHKCQAREQGCASFSCQPGCIIGDRPSFVIPEYSSVRVNLVTSSDRRCYGYFNCSTVRQAMGGGSEEAPAAIGGTALHRGFQPINSHCEKRRTCAVNGTEKQHGSHFYMDCNFCTCSHGRLVCTNRSCLNNNQSTYNCPQCSDDYSPVCTMDGRTLPNLCFAKCLGYTPGQYVTGRDCRASDPCLTGFGQSTRCVAGDSCLPARKICFFNSSSAVRRQCKQYTCVNQDNCNKFSNPVCDNSESLHSSLCSFLRTQSNLDYLGYCKPECSRSRSKLVCGVNGETYSSKCHSDSDYVAVDYYGHCKAIPGSVADGISCAGVSCPALPYAGCKGVTPWDTCCPKCGGHITVLMDRAIMDKNIHALGLESLSSVDIIQRLRYHISSLQCNLYGHYSLDGSFSLLVLPTLNTSLDLLIDTCNQEAVKLATFINNQTPMLASDPYLSHMVAATVQTATVTELHTVSPGGTSKAAQTSAAAQPTVATIAPLALVAVMIVLLLVHFATR